MRAIVATTLGTIICLAFLVAWSFVAPAAGSGWILFAALVGTMWFLKSIPKPGLSTVAAVIIGAGGAGAGVAWYFHHGMPYSGLVLFLCIVCAFGTFSTLNSVLSQETKKASQKSLLNKE